MIAVRPLTYPDLPAVLAIERRAFTTPWSLAMFVLELARPGSVNLAAVDAGLVGYLVCARYPDAFHLMNVAVDPERLRTGVGRGLIEAMLERTGVDANITLEVRVSNEPAIALYEQYGFRSVGTRPRYYADTGEDAHIMWRTIGAPWEAA